MAKIEKLTKEQEARFPEFIKKWTDIGLSTEPANRKEAEEGVKEMYRIAGLKEPKIVWCTSPLAQGLTRSVVQKLESDGTIKKLTGASVWDSVRASVWDSVRASVWASVVDSVGASVGASVWASVVDSVRASVGDSVRASVWASVVDSVGDSVRDSGYGQHDANWLAFYEFFKDVNGLTKETEKLSGIWKVSKNAGWYLPHEKICWISERHNVLVRNVQGQLHNDKGMALAYPDGLGIYALNGVRFEKELWEKITSRKMPFKDILAIKDVDQRRQAMKYGSWEDFTRLCKAEKIDSHILSDIDGNEVPHELWKFPVIEGNDRVFSKEVHFARYLCPSTREWHTKGVPEFKTIAEAMAWGMSNDVYQITAEQWKLHIPLQHAS